jgi:hypothetical protein
MLTATQFAKKERGIAASDFEGDRGWEATT